jgi:hypothetical protein
MASEDGAGCSVLFVAGGVLVEDVVAGLSHAATANGRTTSANTEGRQVVKGRISRIRRIG